MVNIWRILWYSIVDERNTAPNILHFRYAKGSYTKRCNTNWHICGLTFIITWMCSCSNHNSSWMASGQREKDILYFCLLNRCKTNFHMTTKHKNVDQGVIIEYNIQQKPKTLLVLIKVKQPKGASVNVSFLWWCSIEIMVLTWGFGPSGCQQRQSQVSEWSCCSVVHQGPQNSELSAVWVSMCSRRWLLRQFVSTPREHHVTAIMVAPDVKLCLWSY